MMIRLRRLWIQLTADRKRFGMLVGVLALGLLLWARIIIISNPPRQAVADDPSDSASAAASDHEHRSAGQSVITVTLVREPERNPFRISTKHFPKPTLFTNSSEDREKLQQASAEEMLRVEQQRTAQIRAAADRLTLEAVMSGARLAVIDGEIRRIGDTIPSRQEQELIFTLTEVKERSVIVECEGRHIELSLEEAISH